MVRTLSSLGLCLVILAGAGDSIAAQGRGGGSVWPTGWRVDAARPLQEARLPVHDHLGRPIPFAEIEARVDRSGRGGAFWGAILGAAVGGLIATVAAPSCDETVNGTYYPCSPRERATHDARTLGFPLVALVSGAWIGWNADVTTWQDALEELRRERRRTAR